MWRFVGDAVVPGIGGAIVVGVMLFLWSLGRDMWETIRR